MKITKFAMGVGLLITGGLIMPLVPVIGGMSIMVSGACLIPQTVTSVKDVSKEILSRVKK